MSDFDAGPLADVAVRRADGAWTLIFVRDLAHPPAKVWRALTEPDQLAAWAPFLTDRELASPGPAVFTMIDGETRVKSGATVTRAEPPTVLEYTWADDVLRWELVGIAGGTRLTLRHTHVERDLLPKMAAGWHLCLAVAARLLEGDPVAPIRGQAARNFGWDALSAAYRVKLDIGTTPVP